MSRMSRQTRVSAVARVRAMDLTQKEQLADELARTQPHLFSSFLVQQRVGVSLAKMDFLLDILLIGFQAMKESGQSWPLITEDEQDRQMARLVATVRFDDDLPRSLRGYALRQYIETHPEKDLLAFVRSETAGWLQRVIPEQTDKFVVLATLNFVNCIAFASLPEQMKLARRTQSDTAVAPKRGKTAKRL
jgi:hypothetical protein